MDESHLVGSLFQRSGRVKALPVRGSGPGGHMQSKRSQTHPMEPKRALSHPMRREILDYLTEEGGAGGGDLIEALGLTTATVKYHLAVLQDADLVVQVEGSEQGGDGRFCVAADSTDT